MKHAYKYCAFFQIFPSIDIYFIGSACYNSGNLFYI